MGAAVPQPVVFPWCLPFPLPLQSSCRPFPNAPEPHGGFDETPSALVFQGLSLCTLSAVVSICSHVLQEEASLMMADESCSVSTAEH